MDRTKLGKTRLEVSILGVGLSPLGQELSTDSDEIRQAEELLKEALDSGINFIDVAECYGQAEEIIGRTIADRRSEFILATKAGHSTGLGPEWDYETITKSIDRSLKRMKTDHVDLIQLHSCGVDVLEKGDVVHALQDAVQAGKATYIGYSGDNEAAHRAVDSGYFDTLQTSFNVVDQKARTSGLLAKAERRQMGIIVKRPIAGATWGKAQSKMQGFGAGKVRSEDSQYLERSKKMLEEGPIPGEPEDIQFELGFVFSHPEPDVAIVGTSKPSHMRENIEVVRSDLDIYRSAVEEVRRRFERYGQQWEQVV